MAAADTALGKLRTLAMELRPPQLDQLGLREALEWLAARQSAVSGLAVECRFEGLDARPLAAHESACYRIVQEALNNATRHGQAKKVVISVQSDGTQLKCDVCDDGLGFDADAARLRVVRSGSMGLIGMEERAHLAGGRLVVTSAAGAGTTVSAIFLVAATAEAA
jgi:signal transduction histidine kinase